MRCYERAARGIHWPTWLTSARSRSGSFDEDTRCTACRPRSLRSQTCSKGNAPTGSAFLAVYGVQYTATDNGAGRP